MTEEVTLLDTDVASGCSATVNRGCLCGKH